jgi:hypothetical protein
MGKYADKVNAFAQDEANARVYKTQRRLQSYGQTAYMLNVTTNKFRNDIEKKAEKLIAKMEKERIEKLKRELAQLEAKQAQPA